ncbi:hypothetical protein DFH06DRAFT_1132616 [Mycena polygramma]|nr:hypothetical protein DFH06DRAFT_1132616 [Mycena polygramma]
MASLTTLPAELGAKILSCLALDCDGDPPSIIDRSVDRLNVQLACKYLARVCRSEPDMWTNIAVTSEASAVCILRSPEFVCHQIQYSRKRPLRITFDIPVARYPYDDGYQMWASLYAERARWQSLHLISHHTCQHPHLCLRGILRVGSDSPFRSTPLLERLSLMTRNMAERCWLHSNDAVAVDPAGLTFFRSWVPTTIVTSVNTFPLLRRLGLCHQSELSVHELLTRSPALRYLTWGHGNSVGQQIVDLPSIRYLELDALFSFPRILTPKITVLIVNHPSERFTCGHLESLVGHSHSVSSLRLLDLLKNPIRNSDLSTILERCFRLGTLRMSSEYGDQHRTGCYALLEARVRAGYLWNEPDKIREITISALPRETTLPAHAAFSRLAGLSLGGHPTTRLLFPLNVHRVKVGNCPDQFCDEQFQQFRSINNFTDSLICVGNWKDKESENWLILIFDDEGEAQSLLTRTVYMPDGTRLEQVHLFDLSRDLAASTIPSLSSSIRFNGFTEEAFACRTPGPALTVVT